MALGLVAVVVIVILASPHEGPPGVEGHGLRGGERKSRWNEDGTMDAEKYADGKKAEDWASYQSGGYNGSWGDDEQPYNYSGNDWQHSLPDKRCGVDFDECRAACSNATGCNVFVYNYPNGTKGEHPKWGDGCCWLKTGCTGKTTMHGKRAVILPEADNGTEEDLWDTDCKGEDLYKQDAGGAWTPYPGSVVGASSRDIFQKKCGVDFGECKQSCSNTTGCSAFVHNYAKEEGANSQWSDGCCWMKAHCAERREMKGKRAIVLATAGGKDEELWDTDCRGADLYRGSSMADMKRCGIEFDACREMCKANSSGCKAFVYNYPSGGTGTKSQWSDRCCWLKSGCSSRTALPGKRAVVLAAAGAKEEDLLDFDCSGEDLGAPPLPTPTPWPAYNESLYGNDTYDPNQTYGSWNGSDAEDASWKHEPRFGQNWGANKHCNVTFDGCRELCDNSSECRVVVYNYPNGTYENGTGAHAMWDDGCCWLKTGCSGRMEMNGKRAVILADTDNGTEEELWDVDCRGEDLYNPGQYTQGSMACGSDGMQITSRTQTPFDLCVHSKEDVISSFFTRDGLWRDCRGLPALYQLAKKKKDAGTVVDVGANIGSCTMELASLGARVIAFEPVRSNFELLNHSITLNKFDGRVEAHQVAVGSDHGPRMAMKEVGNYGNTIITTWDKVHDNDRWYQTKFEKEEVQIAKLDDFVDESVDLLKLDCQGYELRVLRGAAKLLRHHRVPLIRAEVDHRLLRAVGDTPQELFEYLHDLEYDIFVIDHDEEFEGAYGTRWLRPSQYSKYSQRLIDADTSTHINATRSSTVRRHFISQYSITDGEEKPRAHAEEHAEAASHMLRGVAE